MSCLEPRGHSQKAVATPESDRRHRIPVRSTPPLLTLGDYDARTGFRPLLLQTELVSDGDDLGGYMASRSASLSRFLSFRGANLFGESTRNSQRELLPHFLEFDAHSN